MIKKSVLARVGMLISIAITLIIRSGPANSKSLEIFSQNKPSLKLSSNELIYNDSINGYLLLSNMLIEYGTISIKSDNFVIYTNNYDINNSIVLSIVAKNTINEIFSKFCIFNQHELVIESKIIECNGSMNEIKITDVIIKNMDDKTPLCCIIAPTIVINTKNGTFKAYKVDNNKVRVMIPSILDFKKFKPIE
ncbi:hypothetical protein [Candidatus Kinetoplastidibacterium galati]|uniref:Uncharacterized protein n=1 Tax=Candidatus Kinetoplastidibacterium galati TCC219 TaxID=1208921 RepID=M1LZ63_9PROT|nr:hypothetical protein [Candidatus Kinetoplastibacterium galatii]AGF49351.1 hypothetical protein ST1E_0092 [Candidatus Kinetoplastibacterium galatii TCC219]